MTRNETRDVLMVIQAAYPNFKVPDKTIAINTWDMFLEDYSYEQVILAVKSYILSNSTGFAPSIGQIIERLQMFDKKSDDELNELAAWALVRKAIGRSGYYADEEFEKLPINCQKAVGSPENLREWGLMPIDTVESVEQSHFLRSYRSVVERERDMHKFTSEIREQLQMDCSEPKKIVAVEREQMKDAKIQPVELTATQIAKRSAQLERFRRWLLGSEKKE